MKGINQQGQAVYYNVVTKHFESAFSKADLPATRGERTGYERYHWHGERRIYHH